MEIYETLWALTFNWVSFSIFSFLLLICLYKRGWLSPSEWKRYWNTKSALFELEESQNKFKFALNEMYNRLHKCRSELMYQYDWAIERGDPKEVIRNIGRNIVSYDKELDQIQSDHKFIEDNGFLPLRKVAKCD